jgi:hypothetical protein
MTTSIKILSERKDNTYFSEDSTVGVERIGKSIIISESTTNSLSGVKRTLLDSVRSKKSKRTRKGAKSPPNEQDAVFANKIRQGVEVRGVFDLASDFLPYISVGNKDPYPFHYKEKMLPGFDEDFYGVPGKINRENFIPFDDINKFHPVVRINITNINANKMFPVFTGSHYNDEFTLQAALEPFEIRKRRSSRRMIESVTHVSDRGFFTGVRCNLMGGGFEESEKGSVMIQDVYKINDKSSDILRFDDTRHVNRLTTTHLPINFKESSGKVTLKPFADRPEFSLLKSGSSYGFMSVAEVNTLYSSSIKTLSRLGNLEISATAGFVYESTTLGNTTSGTDSIAYGGFAGERLSINVISNNFLSYSLPS